MWQKVKGEYHMLLGIDPASVGEYRFLSTACGDQVQVRKKNQIYYPSYSDDIKLCQVCNGVWHINFTSVDDARHSIREQNNLKVLRRALELADRKTLKAALQSRIRKLEKAGV